MSLAHDRYGSIAQNLHRRTLLRLGLPALAGCALGHVASLRAVPWISSAAAQECQPGDVPPHCAERRALIVVWLQGGASHLETYDPKPAAPSEVRGPYQAIATRAAGVQVSELLPRHAEVADRFVLVRSLVHSGFCHQQGNQQLWTGHPVIDLKQRPENPDIFCIAHRERFDPQRTLPVYVALNPIPYIGSAYLGATYEPFVVLADPNQAPFEVPELRLVTADAARLTGQMELGRQLDRLAAAADRWHHPDDFNGLQQLAYQVLTGKDCRRAFDIECEPAELRDRYGRNIWGQRLLLARRLVEAGVDLVAVSLDGPLCGRVGNWDDHAVNHHIFDAMKRRCAYFDQAVAALISDIYDRGLERRVLIVVTGEFGRTPRISYAADSASGVVQPGRDHWPQATSLLFAGGGVRGGQVIGATDRQGAFVVRRRVGVRDVLASIYRHLGIDGRRLLIPDPSGRPVPALDDGEPISELWA